MVPAAEVAAWVVPDTPGKAASSAYIAVANSLMGDTVIIDTPGVGGIEGDATLAASNTVHSASVVVVVADASAPLTKPEMEFIATAVERTESVIVAVTKIDKHLTRWRDIVAENRSLLALSLIHI